MKKLGLISLALFTFTVILTSCTKDYQCECTYKNEISQSQTLVWDIEDQTQKDAKEACETFTNAGWTEVNCVLK